MVNYVCLRIILLGWSLNQPVNLCTLEGPIKILFLTWAAGQSNQFAFNTGRSRSFTLFRDSDVLFPAIFGSLGDCVGGIGVNLYKIAVYIHSHYQKKKINSRKQIDGIYSSCPVSELIDKHLSEYHLCSNEL